MGIDQYHSWTKQKYAGAFTSECTVVADHVYVDVNATLHEVGRRAFQSEEVYTRELFQTLDRMFKSVVPRKTICLAIIYL